MVSEYLQLPVNVEVRLQLTHLLSLLASRCAKLQTSDFDVEIAVTCQLLRTRNQQRLTLTFNLPSNALLPYSRLDSKDEARCEDHALQRCSPRLWWKSWSRQWVELFTISSTEVGG